MIETKEQPHPVTSEIVIKIHFMDGDTFVQPLPIDRADAVQDFMDWYRSPGRNKVWSWHVLADRQIHMMYHSKIMAVDIEGYIEPDGRSSRWYERLLDRLRLRWF